jgi:hypothetical protein
MTSMRSIGRIFPLGIFAYDQAAIASRGVNVNSSQNFGELADAIARGSTAVGLGVAGATINTSAAMGGLAEL